MTNDDTLIYKVVVNDEEQYSIWFVDREPPPGLSPQIRVPGPMRGSEFNSRRKRAGGGKPPR